MDNGDAAAGKDWVLWHRTGYAMAGFGPGLDTRDGAVLLFTELRAKRAAAEAASGSWTAKHVDDPEVAVALLASVG